MRRDIGGALCVSLLLGIGMYTHACSSSNASQPPPRAGFDTRILQNAMQMLEEGKTTFRHDTFGSERFFGGQLRLHQAIAGQAHGGVGSGLSPRAALGLGLKVDSTALSPQTINAIRQNQVNLDDPAVTISLLASKAVVGVAGTFENSRLVSVGIQCSLCHSTVDDTVVTGIGLRRDGWANRDLDVGKIIALAPTLQPLAQLLAVDEATVRAVLNAWGPGKFDAQLLLDGKGFRPDGKSAATLIPPAFGLAGVNHHTSTGAWGSVTYWNAFVANLEMQGVGTFYDPRFHDPVKYPVAARAGSYEVRNPDDRVTAKLAALQFYQLAIPAPEPPDAAFELAAAQRGKVVFEGSAGCARCHVPPLFTEPGWNLHGPWEIGIDDFQASRSPDGKYRTAPLRGLHSHQKGGFYHDGRFATLRDVVDHYDTFFTLGLSPEQKNDLIEYLKSL